MTAPDQPTPFVYYAEPIDQTGAPVPGSVEIFTALTYAGFNVFRPRTAFKTTEPDPRVEKINRTALYQADAIVACLPVGYPSIGVPAEIEAATSRGIPAVVYHNGNSQVLAGNPLVTVVDSTVGINQVVLDVLAHPLQMGHWMLATADRIEQAERQWKTIPVQRTYPRRGLLADPGAVGTTDPFEAYTRAGEPGPRWKDIGLPAQQPLRLVIADGQTLPTRAYPDDAGIDLLCATDGEHSIYPGEMHDLETQVKGIHLPAGYWGMVTGRSSAIRDRGLHVPVGVIDYGYRGPLYVGAWNLTKEIVRVKPGDRIGQLVLIPQTVGWANGTLPPIERVDAVEDHPRGEKGFGSSGA